MTADYFKSCDRCEPATKFDPDSDSFFKIHFSTSYAWNITAAGPFKVPLRVWVSFRNLNFLTCLAVTSRLIFKRQFLSDLKYYNITFLLYTQF